MIWVFAILCLWTTSCTWLTAHPQVEAEIEKDAIEIGELGIKAIL